MMKSEQMVLADELDDCAKLCAVYSPDQCATLIDGIGWIAMRHKLRRAAHLLRALEQREAGHLPGCASSVPIGLASCCPPRDVPDGREAAPVDYSDDSDCPVCGYDGKWQTRMTEQQRREAVARIATPRRDVPEAVIAEAINRAIAAVEPMYGERQDTWIARVREHARAMLAAAPSGEVG